VVCVNKTRRRARAQRSNRPVATPGRRRGKVGPGYVRCVDSIVILGAGTGGTLVANRLRRSLLEHDAQIVVVDQDDRHVYQPGLLFVPFGLAHLEEITRPRGAQLHGGIRYVQSPIERVELEHQRVLLADGTTLAYDVLIIATGAELVPEETEGLTGPGWGKKVFTFFGLDAIHKARHDHIKVATVGNPGLHLATVAGGLPGVSSVMTHYLEKKMEKLDIPPIPEFIEMIADTGAGLYGCKASVDLFALTRADLIDEVTEIITVGEFYAMAAGGQIIFT
jgi:peroxiredoxin family protein